MEKSEGLKQISLEGIVLETGATEETLKKVLKDLEKLEIGKGIAINVTPFIRDDGYGKRIIDVETAKKYGAVEKVIDGKEVLELELSKIREVDGKKTIDTTKLLNFTKTEDGIVVRHLGNEYLLEAS